MKYSHTRLLYKRKAFGSVCWLALALLLASCSNDKGPNYEYLDVREAEDEAFAVDLMVFLDSSGSIAGSDPNNLRMEATRRMIERIARENALSAISRIGVLCFSDDAQIVVPLGQPSVVKDAVASVRTSNSGNTNLLSALHTAYRTFSDADTFPRRKPVVLLFTDGSPYDDRKLREMGAYFLELRAFIEEKLRPRGCAIHVVGIDARKRWSQVEEYWQNISDSVYVANDTEQLELALSSIMEQIYSIPPVAREVVTPKEKLFFTVPPYTEKLEVYVLNQKDEGHLTIHRPDGSAVLEVESDVLTEVFGSYRSLSIHEPVCGRWQLVAKDGEFATYRRAIPYKLRLVKPDSIHPVGKPLRVEAAFLKRDDNPVPELSDHKLRFSGQMVSPDGKVHRLKLEAATAGQYRAKSALTPDVEGLYKIALIVQGGDSFGSVTAETVTVKSMPYVAINDPADSTLKPGDLEVMVSLLQAGEQLSIQQVKTNSLLARLEKPSGEVATTWLELRTESNAAVLSGSFPGGLSQEGQYKLEVKQVDSEAVAETAILQVRKGYLNQLRQWSTYTGVGLIGLSFLAVLTFLIRARGFPRIMGNISNYLSSDQDIFLGQRQIYRKRWTLMYLKRYSGTAGRWLLATGAPGGDEAIDIWYRSGLTLVKRRLYKDNALRLDKRRLEYI